MTNLVFPSLRGLDIKVGRSPIWATMVQAASSGKELRASWQAFPRYRYTLTFNFLREAGYSANTLVDEAATWAQFFNTHRGQGDSFLYLDPYDNATTGMGFGVGDGTTTAFQLQRAARGKLQAYPWDPTLYAFATTPKTNLCPRSATLDTGWSNTIGGTGVNPTVTANYAIAPDWTPTADRVQFNQGAGTASTDFSLLYTPTITGLPVGQPITVSIWAKSNTGANQTITFQGGSVASSSSLTMLVTPQWQRFSFNLTAAAASGFCGFGLRGTVTSASTADVCLWGMQVETGSTANPYIPTTTAAVTTTPKYYPLGGDGFEPVQNLASFPTVYVNGVAKVPVTDFTVSSAGVVTFTAAPAAGAALTWDGSYYTRVRFEKDQADWERMGGKLWDGKTMTLISTK